GQAWRQRAYDPGARLARRRMLAPKWRTEIRTTRAGRRNGREGDDGVGETGQMIAHRLYQPQADDLIYHYCGADAFLNIVKSQTMWFSATYTLNDYMEQRWGLSVYRQAVSKLAQDVDGAFLENIDPLIEQAYLSSLLLISSYSLDGDVL